MNQRQALAIVAILENAVRELRRVVETEFRDEPKAPPAAPPTPAPAPAPTWQREPNVDYYLRLPQVLERLPMSASSWWRGIQEGRYPKSTKLGSRMSAWRESEIQTVVEQLNSKQPARRPTSAPPAPAPRPSSRVERRAATAPPIPGSSRARGR